MELLDAMCHLGITFDLPLPASGFFYRGSSFSPIVAVYPWSVGSVRGLERNCMTLSV